MDSSRSLFVKHETCRKCSIHNYFYCLLIITDARCIGELLQVNSTLLGLVMGWNNIGDDGITAIAGALSKSRIMILQVFHCGITVTGAKELAAGLAHSSITELEVFGNPITVEGARLILQSAVDNGVCKKVVLDYEHREDKEVKKMTNILETRQKVGIECNLSYKLPTVITLGGERQTKTLPSVYFHQYIGGCESHPPAIDTDVAYAPKILLWPSL